MTVCSQEDPNLHGPAAEWSNSTCPALGTRVYGLPTGHCDRNKEEGCGTISNATHVSSQLALSCQRVHVCSSNRINLFAGRCPGAMQIGSPGPKRQATRDAWWMKQQGLRGISIQRKMARLFPGVFPAPILAVDLSGTIRTRRAVK